MRYLLELGIIMVIVGTFAFLHQLHKDLAVISRQLNELTLTQLSRQSTVKSGKKVQQRAVQVGPRHTGTRGARQVPGAKFEMVGGEHERNDEGNRLQPGDA
jgi:hypothetical protein